jgi:hypothetical protein
VGGAGRMKKSTGKNSTWSQRQSELEDGCRSFEFTKFCEVTVLMLLLGDLDGEAG